jgi:hypothetical protein
MCQVLRNLVVSRRFEDEFLDLNERLSGCYQDLILALNIQRSIHEVEPARCGGWLLGASWGAEGWVSSPHGLVGVIATWIGGCHCHMDW